MEHAQASDTNTEDRGTGHPKLSFIKLAQEGQGRGRDRGGQQDWGGFWLPNPGLRIMFPSLVTFQGQTLQREGFRGHLRPVFLLLSVFTLLAKPLVLAQNKI